MNVIIMADNGGNQTLQKIKDAEKKAEEVLAKGHSRKSQLIADAKKDAFENSLDYEKKAEKERARLLEKVRSELVAEKEKLILKNKKEADSLRKSAGPKIGTEADFLVKKFMEAVRK